MEGKLVHIKMNGDDDISPALFQRSLLRTQDEYQTTLSMADGRPAGHLWLDELDDLVVTNRYPPLHERNQTKHVAQHL